MTTLHTISVYVAPKHGVNVTLHDYFTLNYYFEILCMGSENCLDISYADKKTRCSLVGDLYPLIASLCM